MNGGNTGLAKVAVQCSVGTFVVNQTLIFQIISIVISSGQKPTNLKSINLLACITSVN